MDRLSPERRSWNMSRIPGKDTKPEELVRKFLFANGFRYRKNDKRLPGKPDIVLPKFKTVVFVNGCFWHNHTNCQGSRLPKTNTDFWREKLLTNEERDRREYSELEGMGWKVLIIWECQLKRSVIEATLQKLVDDIRNCH